MMNAVHPIDTMDDSHDIPYDLSYDDMDSFVRSCGVVLPEDPESSLRHLSFI